MKVAVTWWGTHNPPGGASQATRGNVKGFIDAGHDVDLWHQREIEDLEEHASEYDLVLAPYLWADQYGNLSRYKDTHLHVQIGGYGNTEKDTRYLKMTVEAADTVSALDPGPVLYYDQQVDLPLDEIRIIPNAPNFDLFPQQPIEDSTGFVLSPKVGAYHKTGAYLVQTAQQTPQITYEAHLKTPEVYARSTGGQVPGNVHLKPPVPFSSMPDRYRDSALVFNAAERETMPNVCFEALLSGRPYVSYKDAVALIQTIPELDPADFGLTFNEFISEYEDQWYTGDHLLLCWDETQMHDTVKRVLTDRELRAETAELGREWIEDSFAGFDWEEKARRIAELVG